eukprot:31311-Pelagococcus_subviridis.AAC.1
MGETILYRTHLKFPRRGAAAPRRRSLPTPRWRSARTSSRSPRAPRPAIAPPRRRRSPPKSRARGVYADGSS